jgi:hypothetical protein
MESDMQRPVAAALAGLFLVLSSHFAIASEASLKDVNRALASPQPAVLIGVPAGFLHPEDLADSDEGEVLDDWSHYLDQWTRKTADKRRLKVIVVPMMVLSRALQRPVLKGDCATLFVKNRTEGLLFDAHCVPQVADYDAGAKWLDGTASEHDLAEHGFKTTPVAVRDRK